MSSTRIVKTLTDKIKARVARATVHFTKKDGRGVLVGGNLIFTAAHCIEFPTDGGMVLGDWLIEPIETLDGRALKVTPFVVEQGSDFAACCSLDNQTFDEEADSFEEFCENTEPVPLCTKEFELFEPFPVWVYTHKGEWITGTGQRVREHGPSLAFSFEQQIECGTSGSGIITEDGELVGIASSASQATPGAEWNEWSCTGAAPYPFMAMPVWLRLSLEKEE